MKNNVLAATVELLQVSGVAVVKTLRESAVAADSKRSRGRNKIKFVLNNTVFTQYQLYTGVCMLGIINNDPAYQKLLSERRTLIGVCSICTLSRTFLA